MRAKECMCKNVVCANPETTVSEVAKLMEKSILCLSFIKKNLST